MSGASEDRPPSLSDTVFAPFLGLCVAVAMTFAAGNAKPSTVGASPTRPTAWTFFMDWHLPLPRSNVLINGAYTAKRPQDRYFP